MVNDHTRSAENWKCVWYLLRLYIYIRVYVDSHSLGQLALASKRTASFFKIKTGKITRGHDSGHDFMVVEGQSRLDLRKYSFSQRTVNDCNKLPADCVHSSSVKPKM